MKILVVSDTHGNFANLKKVLDKESDINVLIHLGDGLNDLNNIRTLYPNIEIIIVRGNCDRSTNAPKSLNYVIYGKKIFLTHGHEYGVKTSLYSLYCATRETNADMVLFGHTHDPINIVEENLTIMNPGSLNSNYPTYGIITIDKDKFVTEILSLN